MAEKRTPHKSSLYRAEVIEKESRDYFLKASEKTDNPLTKRTFQIISERHAKHSERIEQTYRAAQAKQPPEPEAPAQPRPVFEEIVRRLEQTTSPTAENIAEMRDAIVYATKIRDVYVYLENNAAEERERMLFAALNREEDGLKTSLVETLGYLRSNFQISRVPKET